MRQSKWRLHPKESHRCCSESKRCPIYISAAHFLIPPGGGATLHCAFPIKYSDSTLSHRIQPFNAKAQHTCTMQCSAVVQSRHYFLEVHCTRKQCLWCEAKVYSHMKPHQRDGASPHQRDGASCLGFLITQQRQCWQRVEGFPSLNVTFSSSCLPQCLSAALTAHYCMRLCLPEGRACPQCRLPSIWTPLLAGDPLQGGLWRFSSFEDEICRFLELNDSEVKS